jgi:hypothetical protein
MKKENFIALIIALFFSCLLGLTLFYLNNNPQALLINTVRLIFSDSRNIKEHFAPSFISQFQNAYCSSNIFESKPDNEICILFQKTPSEFMALKIFKAYNTSAYGWPKIEMNQNGNFQMIYTINSNQNFKSVLYGHSNGDCLVFDSISNVCELIERKPNFRMLLQES